ncbi:MAG: IMP dehydrogenase [Bacteroidales bacterium]|nr:IMP dehydrogenase [Bacteroidales bacterium]
MSFNQDKVETEGLTFDDVLLIPAYSEVMPRETDISSLFTPSIRLNTPIVSAAMDTVTEERLAMAIAREGGIGVIHKNMSIEEQARQVISVKRAENGMIMDPITIHPEQTVKDVRNLMAEYGVGGIPVVNDESILVGIITRRDLRFEFNSETRVSDVMTKDSLITTGESTGLDKAAEILQKHKIEKLPVVDDHNRLVGLMTYKDITITSDRPNACKDERGRLRVAAAVGITPDTIDRIDSLVQAGVDAITIDTAHGHSINVIKTLKAAKTRYPEMDFIVGNIGTGSAAKALASAGASAVKVGIGPGSICTTRVIAGVGLPQLSAIYDVSKALRGSNIQVIADGGIRYSGDIVKAIAAGADSVMVGSLFAGTDESPGETIIFQGRKFKSYRGMGSIEAMQKGSRDRYFQDVEDDINKLVPEGIAARVPFKGNLREVIYQMIGGLRAGMGYCGAARIEDLQQARFVRITNSGIEESHPHDVTITREAPNYSR